MRDQTIESKLLFTQNAISNAITIPDIKLAVAGYGYNEVKMKHGEGLYTEAAKLQKKAVKERGDQYTATDALNLAKVHANKEYIKHVKISRLALKEDRGLAESLLIQGRRKESISGWLKQATTFYTNATTSSQVLAAFGEYNITKGKLSAAEKLVKDVQVKYSKQRKEIGESQSATQLRDEAFDIMQDWVSDFIAIARIALEEQPQYMEMLGIVESS